MPLSARQKEEFKKCQSDLHYFINTYVQIEHQKLGVIPFHLHGFQNKLAAKLLKHRFNIVNKSRQTGISTLAAAYCLWAITFFKNKLIMVISRNDKEAIAFVEKVKLAYDRLPNWMKHKEEKRNEHALHLSTGSRVEAEASGKNAGRSRSMFMLILDEAAFIDKIRSIQKAALPALSRGNGRLLVISTPNGRSGWFAETWRAAGLPAGDPKKNKYIRTFCDWRDVPEYDDDWYEEMRPQFTDKEWAQEYEGDFLGSGDTVVPGEWLKNVEKSGMLRDPIEMRNHDNQFVVPGDKASNPDLWIWARPKPNHAYIMGVDTATPTGRDYSAIQIFDLTEVEQVAEFQGHINLKKLAKLAVDIATEYNGAYAVVESNEYGYMTAQEMHNHLYYWNMYCKRKPSNPQMANQRVPGFQTTPRTRPLLVEGFRSLWMPEYDWQIHSQRLFNEAASFIWKESGKAEADNNAHDDLVMATGLAMGNIDAMMADSPLDSVAQSILGRMEVDNAEEFQELREALQGIEDPEVRREIIREAIEKQEAPTPEGFGRSSNAGWTRDDPVNEFAWLFEDRPDLLIPAGSNGSSASRPQNKIQSKGENDGTFASFYRQ